MTGKGRIEVTQAILPASISRVHAVTIAFVTWSACPHRYAQALRAWLALQHLFRLIFEPCIATDMPRDNRPQTIRLRQGYSGQAGR